jgi:hypothetical protein
LLDTEIEIEIWRSGGIIYGIEEVLEKLTSIKWRKCRFCCRAVTTRV